jgi:hypothetical protein
VLGDVTVSFTDAEYVTDPATTDGTGSGSAGEGGQRFSIMLTGGFRKRGGYLAVSGIFGFSAAAATKWA